MKTIFVIERQDNFGEFQPSQGLYYNTRADAVARLEMELSLSSMRHKKSRIACYVRKEVKS